MESGNSGGGAASWWPLLSLGLHILGEHGSPRDFVPGEAGVLFQAIFLVMHEIRTNILEGGDTRILLRTDV
jgi:hypothetical protein